MDEEDVSNPGRFEELWRELTRFLQKSAAAVGNEMIRVTTGLSVRSHGEGLPNAELHVVSKAGHWFMIEHPASSLYRLCLEFSGRMKADPEGLNVGGLTSVWYSTSCALPEPDVALPVSAFSGPETPDKADKELRVCSIMTQWPHLLTSMEFGIGKLCP